ncbi:MAG: hypothetical protein V3V14_03465 [Saprospiraceae bacterium]
MFRITLLVICFFAYLVDGETQRVTVSKEMKIRNDKAYDILGKIENNILIYRDLGKERIVEVFDGELEFLFRKELQLKENRLDIYTIIPQDTSFTILYGYRKKKLYYLRALKYDQNVNLIDSTTLLNGIADFKIKFFKFKVSQDRSKTLLFAGRKDNLFYTYVIDNNTLDLLWTKESKIYDLDVRKDFKKVCISNKGKVFTLFDVDNIYRDRDNHHLVLYGLDKKEGFFEQKFFFDNKITIDLEMDIDNQNQRLILGGLLSEESEKDATSFFYVTIPFSQLEDEMTIESKEFEISFLENLYGKKLSKKKRLNNFITKDIVLRGDGGFLLIAEMNKEYYRRSAFNGRTRMSGNQSGGRGWLDIYNEDLIVFSFNPNGTEYWKKVLYKKQFSQDDDGVFSSYFLFKTPSRLRLIYNDEIKRNNTVSEYVIDPMGNTERNSLLNTDYQNLKLRFRDGVQISSSAFLVPSERNFKLSLVKIEY